MKRALTVTVGVWVALTMAPVALAQDKDKVSKQVYVTKLYEAYKKSDWKEVTLNFNFLREQYDGLKDKRLVFLNAQAHYKMKKVPPWDEAESALTVLLEDQEDHVGGLYLMAMIKAQSKKKADKERAKDFLLAAARAGQYVLRDINDPAGAKIFKALASDPNFILRVMNASNEFQVSTSGLRNPFKSPLREVTTAAGTKPDKDISITQVSSQLKELERRIEDLFREIAQLAEERQVEELIGKFTDLRAIMAEYGKDGSDLVKKKMEKWNQRLDAYGEVKLSIQLQIYINEGNQHLRTMAESIKKDDYDTALETFESIKELRDQMYDEERDVFHRNADALFLRGKTLADQAARLKKISEFQLDISGIVVTPPNDDQQDSAIINRRIYREGDTIIDENTEEEIEGLYVVEIVRSTVKFRFQDTDFVRELKQP